MRTPKPGKCLLGWTLCLLLAMPGSISHAANDVPPLVTDRPDVTESSEVVPRHAVQIETGYLFASLNLDGEEVEVASIPATLVRFGLDRNVELRLEWAGYVNESRRSNGTTTDVSGVGNMVLGAKIKLRESRGAMPQLALLVDAVMPTGDQGFRTDRVDPRVRLAGSSSISERVSLGWNVGVAALSLEDASGQQHTHGVGRYSVSSAISVSEQWGTFVELFGFIPLSGPDSPGNSIDAGFTYLTSKTVQLDMSAGAGLSDAADDWFVGAGVSFRLPR